MVLPNGRGVEMTKWIIKNKDPILVTVVFGIFLEICRYFFPSIVDFFSGIGISFIDKIIDIFYRMVSTYSPLNYSYSVVQFFAIALFSLSFGFFLGPILAKRKVSMRLAKDMSQEEFATNIKSSIKKMQLLMVIFSTTFFLFVHFFVVLPGMYYSKFDRSMTIVHPYMEEAEYNSLKSKWFLMKSKADYDYIDQRILEIREKNGLKR